MNIAEIRRSADPLGAIKLIQKLDASAPYLTETDRHELKVAELEILKSQKGKRNAQRNRR